MTNINIPHSVTSIGGGAFEGCNGLTSGEIPNSITSIEYTTFSDCSSLKILYMREKVSNIGSEAFSGRLGLGEIIVASLVPPIGNEDIFDNFTYSNACLYVPERSMTSYQTQSPWNNFFTFKTLDESGVEEIAVEGTEDLFDIFNLNGQLLRCQILQSKINSLTPGIYIIGGNKIVVQ